MIRKTSNQIEVDGKFLTIQQQLKGEKKKKE